MSTPTSTLPYQKLPNRTAPALDLLAETKVLDLTTSVAGPYAAQLLADLGATVLKIEKPQSGDDSRAWGPPFLHGESLWFMSVNRGKKSVTLDIATDDGRSVLQQLIGHCDVVLLNLVARGQRKLGLDAATLRKLNPRLIHLSLTGFGSQGKRADLLIPDDIESSKNSATPVQRAKLLHLTKDFISICQYGRIVWLGTPQTMDSIYNSLPARGVAVRIWPGRYPTGIPKTLRSMLGAVSAGVVSASGRAVPPPAAPGPATPCPAAPSAGAVAASG